MREGQAAVQLQIDYEMFYSNSQHAQQLAQHHSRRANEVNGARLGKLGWVP